MNTKLNEYLQQWRLSYLVPLAQTPTSDVYLATRDGARVVLKLLTPVGAADEAGAADAFRYFAGGGAVRLLAHDEKAHLLEYAGDEALSAMVIRGDDLASFGVIGDVLNALHRPQPDVLTPQLQPLSRRFRSLFQRAAQDETAGTPSIYRRGAVVARHLLENPGRECVLHGDIHHNNIHRHPVRGWLAFDAKGLYGERLYDAANAVCNPPEAPERVFSEARLLAVSQILADKLGAPVGRVRAFVFAHACLSASWSSDGDDIQRWFLTVAHNAEPHVDLSPH